MAKLEKSLLRWVELGFIDQCQAKKIKDYEDAEPEGSWVLFGLLVLGVVIVGIGVISLIAANWDTIPDTIKLATDFALLLLLAAFIMRAAARQRMLQVEILILSFIFLLLASIGLISQIYHTGGELYEALMLWSLITLPITYVARNYVNHVVIPFTWLGGFFSAFIWTAYYSPSWIPIFHANPYAIMMVIPLFCAFLSLLGAQFNFSSPYIRAANDWFFITGIVALGVIETQDTPYRPSELLNLTPYMASYCFALLAAFLIIASPHYRYAQKIVLALALLIFLVPFHFSMLMVHSLFAHAVTTILVLTLMAIFAASVHKRGLFQWLLFFVGVRFLILYFQALGGLAMTGLGLIVSGIFIITMAVLWSKYRRKIGAWAERWMQ
jgi:uncharacterized membrane protein